MPKHPETWREFEDIVHKIHKQMVPEGTLRHNEHVIGLCGRKRQLDITLHGRIGSYPVFFVIECKKYRRRVGISDVEAFSRKLQDVRARGIMISARGFDAGAKAIARYDGIILRTVEQAQAMDWSRLGLPSTMPCIVKSFVPHVAYGIVHGQSERVPVGLETQLFTDGSEEPVLLREEILANLPTDRLGGPGPLEVEMQIHPLPALIDGHDCIITSFVAIGEVIAIRYDIPIWLGNGILIKDGDCGDTIFGELTTVPFDWRTMVSELKPEDGRILTSDEYAQMSANGVWAINETTKRFLRFQAIYSNSD